MSLYCSSGRFNASKILERRGTTRSYLQGIPSAETSGSPSCACWPKLCRTSPASTSSTGTPSPSTKASCPWSSIACGRIGTRNEDLCDQMGVKKKIKVEALPWDAAWKLFTETAGKEMIDSHPEIGRQAEILVRKCGGLPLALIAVGRALASKRSPLERYRPRAPPTPSLVCRP
uniref:NB-ARC domain-containing protein n=1 Tax=Musa acuminata subsp. malaccensis TaxID=214687 RepID=A0A804HM23_MUSAM